ncbi:hypothetical protein pipiens_005551 [Culex pipiens pipiens]|uniref:Fibronectin type-III domain-containing protein n=1 Tax=Culex pipiens pipiens TaxID=38569 RepID=A0ABD1DVQ2_CULPP
MLISKYDTRPIDSTESNSSVFDYPIQNLNPFTEYKLGVRLRVIPRSVRLLDEEYWSGWSWTFFKTEARKPDVAPRTIPGAFSFKDHKGDRATLEVFWEPMLESQWNGPGFRYNVSAVSDTGQWFVPVNDSRDLPYEVATFEDITLDHYRILVSCYNDKGSFQGSNIMEDSIRFVTVPSTNTSFSVSSPTVLNFAVSANYPNHSSDFSWQQCLVSPGADIGSPQFDPCNVTDTSFDIRMTTACSSSSLYELLEVYVLTMNGSNIWNTSLDQPQERISVGNLSPDTAYVVKVVAFDESGNPHETSKSVQTAPKFTTMQLTLFFLCGVLLVSALTMGTTRKVNSLRNIHVEMPVALQTLFGIDGEETKMILRSDFTENVERTPRIYVELPSKGYTNIPMVIPEEDDEFEDGSLLKVEAIRSSADTENNTNDVFKEELRDTTLKAVLNYNPLTNDRKAFILEERLMSVINFFTFAKFSPFSGLFRQYISRLVDSGIWGKIYNQWSTSQGQFETLIELSEREIDFDDMVSLWAVTLVAYLICICVFVGEVTFGNRKKKQQ